MLFALAARPSLVDTARTTGRALRRWALQARVTGVSAIPAASFASVLPVQGAITSRSSSFFGPIGSTWEIVSQTGRRQIASIRVRKSAAAPKRLSMLAAAPDRIGWTVS